MVQKEIYLSRLEPEFAAALLAGSEHLDPSGITTSKDIAGMAERGLCFAATAPAAQAVYIIEVKNGIAWVNAAQGFGPADWAGVLLPIIEAQAKGCHAVAFQTARPGLLRRAEKQGYTVTGWILKKAIQ